MKKTVPGLLVICLLAAVPAASGFSQVMHHAATSDDCAIDGLQGQQVTGLDWTSANDEIGQMQAPSGSARADTRIADIGLSPDEDPLAVTPLKVAGVERCRISLNGEWQFSMNPGRTFWEADAPAGDWKPIRVPGECRMQGFAVEHDREYAYRRSMDIPPDFAGKRIVIRFDGVYSYARVWVNGRFVRSHHGGFTSWECDITPFVRAGKRAALVVGVTDRVDEISFGSGYAKHPIGGILRNVELVALPVLHVRTCTIETRFDDEYRNARLVLGVSLSAPQKASIELLLSDPAGNDVPIVPSAIAFSSGNRTASIEIPVAAPARWDAEHPRLYTLDMRLVANGRTEELVRQRFGFREVSVKGSSLFVNGEPVKLRGACRHDIHPLLGRSTTPEQDREDVLLAKEANFNFIRTSHYPPSREFLEYCDEYGIYVEEEAALCFVTATRAGIYAESGGSHDDARYTARYLSQLMEMMDRDRNHPSVIIWSLGNESTYGVNFQKQYDYVKTTDRSRPVIFSYPHTAPKGVVCWDIYSNHYPAFDRWLRLSEEERKIPYPVLSDEWMHVPCYCVQDLQEDPNIRNFWGESINRAWENSFDSDQSIGGAIWGMIDEVFQLPDTCVGYGPWGIVDVWRRRKPEFWHTRKAYSPIRLMTTSVEGYGAGNELVLPVHNRFDHTNLREIQIECASGAVSSIVPSPQIPPHTRGEIRIPAGMIQGRSLLLRFVDGNRRLVDEELVTLEARPLPGEAKAGALRVEETPERLIARGGSFAVAFSRKTGLIESGTVHGTQILDGGPYLRLVVAGRSLSWDVDSLLDAARGEWKLETMRYEATKERLAVEVRGYAGTYAVKLDMVVSGDGAITSRYELDNPPETCQDLGLRFLVNADADQLSWNRHGLWSTYPDDHIGRSAGRVHKFSADSGRERYREKPDHSWAADTKDFFLFSATRGMQPGRQPVPNDFRGLKENIFAYTLWNQRTGAGVRVEAEGTVAARAQVRPDGTIDLFVNNEWTYLNLSWGNYERTVKLRSPQTGTVTVRLCRATE